MVLKSFLRNEERYFFLISTRYFQLTSVLGRCHYRTIINYHAVLITTLSSMHLVPIVEYCSVFDMFINHPPQPYCELIIVFFQVTWCKLVCKSSREEVVHKVLLRTKKSRNVRWKYLFMYGLLNFYRIFIKVQTFLIELQIHQCKFIKNDSI